MIGKIGDNAVILLAAILTICGFALVFLPWGALTPKPGPAPAAVSQEGSSGEVVVGIGMANPPAKPHNP